MVYASPIQTKRLPTPSVSGQSGRVSSRDQGLQYDGNNVLADLTDGNMTKFYVTPFLDQNVSMTVIGGPDAGIYYYSQDGLGSVRTLTDSSANLKNQYDHDAFGVPLALGTNESVEQRYTYTGRESSGVSGAPMYYRTRGYLVGISRMNNRNPWGYVHSEFNLYDYASNNPILRVEPFSEDPPNHGPKPKPGQSIMLVDDGSWYDPNSDFGERMSYTGWPSPIGGRAVLMAYNFPELFRIPENACVRLTERRSKPTRVKRFGGAVVFIISSAYLIINNSLVPLTPDPSDPIALKLAYVGAVTAGGQIAPSALAIHGLRELTSDNKYKFYSKTCSFDEVIKDFGSKWDLFYEPDYKLEICKLQNDCCDKCEAWKVVKDFGWPWR